MSNTPRTDAAYFAPASTIDDIARETRKLERELSTVTANALALSQANAELWSRIRRLEAAGNAMSHEMQFGEWRAGTPRAQANAARDSWLAEMGGGV